MPSTPIGNDGVAGEAGSEPMALPERPRFIPSDYTKRYKPWEEAIRKASYTNVGMEIKVREVDDITRPPAPSVKARRFGRSVVNLLRNKSQHQEPQRYVQS